MKASPVQALTLLLLAATAQAGTTVVIGDSLSAEYEAVPDFPGVDNPTEYARITVEGWESKSWVEVLAELRPAQFDLGRYRSSLIGWADLRFSGYEFNFAIPGFHASQYEDIVNSSLFSNPQYLPFRSALRDALRRAEMAVVWLGANEFRGAYGSLYDGEDPSRLRERLIDDLAEVIDFVLDQNDKLKLVVVNLPDLGAAPDKREAHPDPERQLLVTGATRDANDAIAALAASRNVPVADVYAQSERLLGNNELYFGAVPIIDAVSPDNNPRYHFTRDGLHPNTPSQLEIARIVLDTFNRAYSVSAPQIGDAEALSFLGIDPNQPFWEWAANYQLTRTSLDADPDYDGLPNLVEYAFDLDPTRVDPPPVTLLHKDEGLLARFRPDPRRHRHLTIVTEWSDNLSEWMPIDVARSAPVPGAATPEISSRFRTILPCPAADIAAPEDDGRTPSPRRLMAVEQVKKELEASQGTWEVSLPPGLDRAFLRTTIHLRRPE